MTMFILYLPLAVFSFSVKSSSFALASKARSSLHYPHLCTLYFKKTQNANLSFAVNAILNLSNRGIRITFAANGRNDHVTMFILYLPLAVFSFSVKLSIFALASKSRIILHNSHHSHFKKT